MTLVWHSIRPIAMALERSCDFGETWSVYRYYALSCDVSFMMEDTFVFDGMEPLEGTTPICTSTQSELFSFGFTNAVMTFSTSEHTPLNEGETACYQTITNLRVVMLDFFPEVRLSNTSFQYYGVREWIVTGSCMCDGHADTCVPRPGEEMVDGVDRVYTGCLCQHNTASPSCQECLPGFNSAPFLPGTTDTANTCEACMCNGHAVDCRYDSALSMPLCLNCTDNTVGNQCEGCVAGFYQDPALLLNDPAICRDCDCSVAGISDEEGVCTGLGQCACKANVASLRCNECRSGYFNLSTSNQNGCQVCDCNPSGSQLNEQGIPRCDGGSGECICQENVNGQRCDLCQPGSYDISSGCPSCDCNLGGATSQLCDQASPDGQCPCKPNIVGTICTTPTPGYYFLTLDAFRFEAEEVIILPGSSLVLPVDGRYGAFTGRGFVSLPADVTTAFIFSPPRDSQYEVILRFSSVITATYSISFTLSSLSAASPSLNCTDTVSPSADTLTYNSSILSPGPLTPGYLSIDSVCLSRGVEYQLLLSYTSASSTPLLVDSLVLFPDVSATSTFYSSSDLSFRGLIDSCLPRSAASDVVNRFECEEISFTLITEFLGEDPLLACDCDAEGTLNPNSTCTAFGGGCGLCQPGVTGERCNLCLNGFFGFSNIGCEACDCDPVGSLAPTCTPSSGQCSCKPGVGGAMCGDCLPDHFNFTSEGCTPCACSAFSSSPSCNVSTGQCPCLDGVSGRVCDACTTGFFNLTTSEGCRACECDVVGSVSGTCDRATGQCACLGNLGGRRCSECNQGFFNTGTETSGDACAPCVCSGRSDDCSRNSVEYRRFVTLFNFTQLCSEAPADCGEGWRILARDEAAETFFGPNDVNGLGYILSINMMPMVFVASPFLGNRASSYGFNFTVLLTIVSTAAMNTDIQIRLHGPSVSVVGYPYLEITNNGFEDAVLLSMTISLEETNWFYEDSTSPSVMDFLAFLTNITAISFTADYTVDFIEFIYIRDVSLDLALPPSAPVPSTAYSFSLPATSPVEQCTCPAPYQGASCEACARGYARPSGSIADNCTLCDCNGLTLDCDIVTTVCLNCTGNTVGDRCQRCQDGFYGDPTSGVPCLPCACPLEANSFSPTCFLDPVDGQSTCDSCAEGYMGRNCEVCMNGYFGNPMIGRCTTCECNGNVDPALGPICDMTFGLCMNCQNNTEGFECEICLPGYFGDPGIDVSCEACPCDPRGMAGDCDPLFGTCLCLPNVEGERCDTCRPGFFNITQGVGCTQCNCDPARSTSMDCNQDSGDCTCLANVGSPEDNKCGLCTPGHFNFTAGVGCEDCGCSELAVSPMCDAVTGQCYCQDGATGIKCDDCAFGFTGQVPDCEPCHECYFQWFYIVGNFTVRAESLQSNVDQLLVIYYNGHTEESLLAEIARLMGQLDLVNDSLGLITLEQGDVQEIEIILTQLNATLLTFIDRISQIELDLDSVERTLDELEQYDGTVNMTSVEDLESRLLQLNSTTTLLRSMANQSLAQLFRDQETIYTAWNAILTLNATVESILSNLTEGMATLEPIVMLLDGINATHQILRRNLTDLDMRADRLGVRLSRSTERADSLSEGLGMANSSLVSLSEEVGRRKEEVTRLLTLVQTLNESMQSLTSVADEAENSANDLMLAAQETLNLANNTLQNVTDTLNSTQRISDDLAEALRIAEAVQAVTLPSQQYVSMLADRIVSNIVPDELVSGIMEDVQQSRLLAEQALQLASNASAAVNSTLALIMQLQEEIMCTNTTQMEVEELQSVVAALISQAQADIDLVSSLFSQLEQVNASTIATYNATVERIEEATALGLGSRMEASQLLTRSMQQAALALQYRDDVRAAQNDLDQLTTIADAAAANASAVFAEAQELNDQARMLESDVARISFQDIDSLLDDYQQEVVSTRDLQQRIDSLTSEMEELIEIFTSTSLRLQQCYRTP